MRIADLAREMGTTEAELADDLDTLSMCGVAPYDPGDLTPIYLEDGYVEVWGEIPALKGMVRLAPSEAAALSSALQAAGFSAHDDLVTRLITASASTAFNSDDLARTVRSASVGHSATVYETLAQALRGHRVVEIEYTKTGTAEPTTRRVEPVSLYSERGAWYLTGWCRRAGDWRTFRVDRIAAAALLSESFDPETNGMPARTSNAFHGDALPSAILRFTADEPFSEREWPGAQVRALGADGSVTVSVPYGGTAWIARQVIARMGEVEVLEPEEVRAAVRDYFASTS